eukprot:TRINITY_DN37946_c0_g1_i2.p1 TRINITY_DN37946_c0_g1~~TRINITY_DN37946_c0_g1_i2.p1  ORF type:complete len:361 (+),score=71.18 TRINITY_DN37946_c0_g1_i2:106-1083(+)
MALRLAGRYLLTLAPLCTLHVAASGSEAMQAVALELQRAAQAAALEDDAPSEADCTRLPRTAGLDSGTRNAVAWQLPPMLMTAQMCQSREDLELWRACQVQEVRHHVPPNYKRFAARSTERAFAIRSAALQHRPVPAELAAASGGSSSSSDEQEMPVFLVVAQACQTSEELFGWRSVQMAEIPQRVPPAYQQFARDAVQGIFDGRLQEIRRLTRWLGPNGSPASSMAAAMTAGPELEKMSPEATVDMQSTPSREETAAGAESAAMEAATSALSASDSKGATFFACLGLMLPALFAFVAAVLRGSPRPAARAAAVADAGDIYMAQV